MTEAVSFRPVGDGVWIDDSGRTWLRGTVCFVLVTTLFASAAWVSVHDTSAIAPPLLSPPEVVMINLAPLPPVLATPAAAALPSSGQRSLSEKLLGSTAQPRLEPRALPVPASTAANPLLATQVYRQPVQHRKSIHVHRQPILTLDRIPPMSATAAAPQLPVAAVPKSPSAAAVLSATAPPTNTIPAWQGQLLARLEQFKRYPQEAKLQRKQGVAYLRFSLDRDGRVLSAHIEKTSGCDLLDQETLALIQRAQPLPKPPPGVAGDRIELVVPIDFFLRRQK